MTTSARAAAVVAVVAAALTGCGGSAGPAPTARPTPTLVAASGPGGALAGFLAAAGRQQDDRLRDWLAAGKDTAHLDDLLRVYSAFASSAGLFWEVAGVHVVTVGASQPGRADVVLSGDIVWCVGLAVNDPAATCSVVTPVAGMPHTYGAVLVDGTWKADVDVNASSGLDHNPGGSPSPSLATATATPT